jgi:hypothetical protein
LANAPVSGLAVVDGDVEEDLMILARFKAQSCEGTSVTPSASLAICAGAIVLSPPVINAGYAIAKVPAVLAEMEMSRSASLTASGSLWPKADWSTIATRVNRVTAMCNLDILVFL